MTMPLTRLANSVIDAVGDNVDAVVEDIAKYFGTDLLFYRAGHPQELVAREAAALGSGAVLGRRKARRAFHSRRRHRPCAAARCRRSPRRVRRCRAIPGSIAALHLVTTMTGSALLAVALLRGRLDADQVWAAAHVDEDWNIEQWGVDEEVAARRAARLVDFRASAACS